MWKSTCAENFEQSMGARNLEKKGLSYRPARLQRLVESIPWNRFLGSIKVQKYRLWFEKIRQGGNGRWMIWENWSYE
jgi:hypothetical protein